MEQKITDLPAKLSFTPRQVLETANSVEDNKLWQQAFEKEVNAWILEMQNESK